MPSVLFLPRARGARFLLALTFAIALALVAVARPLLLLAQVGLGTFEAAVEAEIWQQLLPFGHAVDSPAPGNVHGCIVVGFETPCYAAFDADLNPIGPTVGPPALGQLSFPYGLAVDSGLPPNPAEGFSGTIYYVADLFNNRIQAFDSVTGAPLPFTHPIGNGQPASGPFDSGGATGERLNQPQSLAVDASHRIIVGDAFNSRIAVFNPYPDGSLAFTVAVEDPFDGDVPRTPTGVAISPCTTFMGTPPTGCAPPAAERLVITDTYHCYAYVYDAAFTLLNRIGSGLCGAADGDISSPGGAAIDAAGHIYITDYDNSRIAIFDANGNYLGKFGTPPSTGFLPPDALQGPYAVTIDPSPFHAGSVIVADTENQRLGFFDVTFPATGPPIATFLFSLNAAGDLNGHPIGVAVDLSQDPVGKIVVSDTTNHRVQRFQVPNLAVVQARTDTATHTGSFGVVVPVGKPPVVGVTAAVVPTNANATVVSGPTAQAPAPPTPTIHPGEIVTYTFSYTSSASPVTFSFSATGNGGNTTSPTLVADATVPCSVASPCASSAEVIDPATNQTATPVNGWYSSNVIVRITATSSIGVSKIAWRFQLGPEASAQPGLHLAPAGGATTAVADVNVMQQKRSVLEFWAVNALGLEESPHHTLTLGLDLERPFVTFQKATPLPNPDGWWNGQSVPVSVPFGYTDDASGVNTITGGSSPLMFSAEGANQRQTVTVTDFAGHSTVARSDDPGLSGQPVNIDLTPPVVSVTPGTIPAIELTGPAGAQLAPGAFQVTATDALSGRRRLAVDPPACTAGGVFPLGTTTCSFTATDFADNQTVVTRSVIVRDTITPFLTCPATLIIPADETTGKATLPDRTTAATATDASQSVTLTQTPLAGSLRGIGTTIVSLTGADPSGNTAACTTNVIVSDVTPPVLTVPPNQTVEGGAAVSLAASATDNSGLPVTIANSAPATFPVGATPVTFTATDAAGNVSTMNVIITVVDTTPPSITACAPPRSVQLGANGLAALPNLTASVTAADYSAFSIAQSPSAGTSIVAGITPVTITVTDALGNHSSCATSVTASAVSAAPEISVRLKPGILWPPNHKLVTITATIAASDRAGTPAIKLVSITSSERDNGLGDGDTPKDIQGATYQADDRTFQLRAERSGKGPGRIYTVTYSATGPTGLVSTAVATVVVPHDMKGDDDRGGDGDKHK